METTDAPAKKKKNELQQRNCFGTVSRKTTGGAETRAAFRSAFLMIANVFALDPCT